MVEPVAKTIKRMDPIPRAAPSSSFFNTLIDEVNRQGKISGGPGVLIGRHQSGMRISLTQASSLLNEPAMIVDVVNDESTDTLPAFGVAGIFDSVDDQDKLTRLQGRRAFLVRKPTAEDAGRVAILLQPLPPGRVGKACIGGVCLVNVLRWFDSVFLDKADVLATKDYALVSIQGSLQILWEEVDDVGDLVIDEEHFAIVKFADDFQPFRIFNEGSTTLPVGTAAIPSDTTGLDTGGRLSVEEPDEDSARSVYTIVGGDVAASTEGRAVLAGRPFLARVDAAPDVKVDVYGTEDTENEFIQGQVGFLPLADLGTHDGEDWAVLHAVSPFLIRVPDGAYVDEASPNTNFSGSNPLVKKTSGGGEEQWAIFKLPRAIARIQLIIMSRGGMSGSSANAGGGSSTFAAGYEFGGIEDDFDLTTVTWNTKPAFITFGFGTIGHSAGSSDGDNSIGSAISTARLARHADSPQAPAAGKLWRGFYLRIKTLTGQGIFSADMAFSAIGSDNVALVAVAV